MLTRFSLLALSHSTLYALNQGSNTLTGFAVNDDGRHTLLDPSGVSASLGATNTPLDLDVTGDGQYLYVLEAGAGTIGAVAIAPNGSLTPLSSVTVGTPRSGQHGIAVY